LKWQSITTNAKAKEDNINRLQIEQEARIADQRRVDAEVEQKRQTMVQLGDESNDVQKRYYDLGTEIARVEDSIQFQNERNQELNRDLEQVSENWYKIRSDIDNDQRRLGELRHELGQTEPRQDEVRLSEETSGGQLIEAEQAMQAWQQNWEEFNILSAQSQNKGQVQQARIASLEQSIERLNQRLIVLNGDVERLEGLTVEQEISPLESMLETQEVQIARIEEELRELVDKIETQRVENQSLNSQLDEKRSSLQGVRGRYASLEALQQSALGQQDDAEMEWLQKHNMKNSTRLGEKLKVDDHWAVAAETVLGDYLQAVCVDGVDAVSAILGDFEKGSLNFMETNGGSAPMVDATMTPLLSQLSCDVDLSHLMNGVMIAETLDEALATRSKLQAGQSVITPEGIWLGVNWLRVSKDQDATAGVIKRQAELTSLEAQIEELQATVGDLTEGLEEGVAALQVAEKDRDNEQTRLAEQQRAFSETRAQLGAKKLQAEQIKTDLGRANDEIESNTIHVEEDQENLKLARNTLQGAMDDMEQNNLKRESMQHDRHEKQQQLEDARTRAREHRDASHQLALKIQSLNSQVTSTEQAMTRLQEQQALLAERKAALEVSINESEEPQVQLKQELAVQLEKRLSVEVELKNVRQKSEAIEHEIRNLEQERSRFEEQVEQIRTSLDQVRMDWQALEVRRTTIKEQLEEDGEALDDVLSAMPEDAEESSWEENLTRIGNRIQRLGAINLAAIDEFKVQSERKVYLDAQNEDLEKALQTLENAIRRIDVETRTRFKETFDKVNNKLQQLFPKIFGGGHAYLEMTGEDLLDTGVGLMARPPGKRNSSIHLLSGGEKALTAIALVFSIFSLNPAPFCMLDEVDAPLDDANVGRYSNLVKEMSRTVQFIYITHNKIAMEMAEQLMGVTMHEPGVSRMVSVDVDEAVALAAV
jgi:chromosome segregation protein